MSYRINSVKLTLEVYRPFSGNQLITLPLYTDPADPLLAIAEARWLAYNEQLEQEMLARAEPVQGMFTF